MAIEEALVALTAELKRNSDLLEILTSKAKAGIAKPAEEAKKAEEDEAPKKAAAKDEGEEEAPKTRRTRAPKEDAPKKSKAVSVAELKKVTEKYLDVDDENEYATRRKFIKGIITKFDAPKMTEIADEHRNEAYEMVVAAMKGENVDTEEDDMIG